MIKLTKKQLILFLTFITLIIVGISIISVKATQSNQSRYYVYIDPGHGGFDGGATSIDKNTIEKDITLCTSLYLQNYLERTGIKVKLTRNKDEALSKSKKEDIHKRVKYINDSNCDIYISIHANAYPAESVRGSQTFYNSILEENVTLATMIMNQLHQLDASNKRVAKNISGKYILDHTNKVGCLVELGFLTNQMDLQNLKNDQYLQKIAFYIYLGIIHYFEESRHYG